VAAKRCRAGHASGEKRCGFIFSDDNLYWHNLDVGDWGEYYGYVTIGLTDFHVRFEVVGPEFDLENSHYTSLEAA